MRRREPCNHWVPEFDGPEFTATFQHEVKTVVNRRGETIVIKLGKKSKPTSIKYRTVHPKPGECPVCDVVEKYVPKQPHNAKICPACHQRSVYRFWMPTLIPFYECAAQGCPWFAQEGDLEYQKMKIENDHRPLEKDTDEQH